MANIELAKPNLRHLGKGAIEEALLALGQPKFRAGQVWSWIWQKGAPDFASMSNLPASLRQVLGETYDLYHPREVVRQKSHDGTVKLAFRLFDDELVEGVLIPHNDRMTACVSSQVGCSLACSFCATARLPRKRNLYFDEIVDQVSALDGIAHREYGLPLSNIVFMGMGEPLLNFSQVLASIERITAPDGLNMSPKRITVSTAGIAKAIMRLADEEPRVNLALSLHAASDEKRTKVMAINETNNLATLKDALQYWYAKTGNRPTLEYVMLKDFNDSIEDARALATFSNSVASKVNLIEYNPIEGGIFNKTSGNALHRFKDALESARVITNIRRSRGEDIDAACGQLANKQADIDLVPMGSEL